MAGADANTLGTRVTGGARGWRWVRFNDSRGRPTMAGHSESTSGKVGANESGSRRIPHVKLILRQGSGRGKLTWGVRMRHVTWGFPSM